jgi:hypothetical protein
MKYNLYQSIVIVAIVILFTGCAKPTMKTENIKTFSIYKQKTLDELGSFDFERRLYIYETIDELANQLRKSPKSFTLKKAKKKTLEKFPIFMLSDRDLDGKADQFAYYPEKGGETQEHGFIFDLNKDGKIDYVVFNGGILPTKGFKSFVWHNYHGIDSNNDGKVDIYVYSNNIDLDGDKQLDEGISGWVYDTDFDGIVDRAEYLGQNFIEPIEKKEGVFIIKTVFGDGQKWGKEPDFKKDFFMHLILSDINSIRP